MRLILKYTRTANTTGDYKVQVAEFACCDNVVVPGLRGGGLGPRPYPHSDL